MDEHISDSLEGLQVLNFDPKNVQAHPKVVEWSKTLKAISADVYLCSYAHGCAGCVLDSIAEFSDSPNQTLGSVNQDA
ncbi:hypothetical protein EDB19DRAFT_575423 [Suillus lakei]|nr:hypothetical protein EDB19DRAFT_575423 [Suillus lakei]